MSYSGKCKKIKQGKEIESAKMGYGAAFWGFCGPGKPLLTMFYLKGHIQIRTPHTDRYDREASVHALGHWCKPFG